MDIQNFLSKKVLQLMLTLTLIIWCGINTNAQNNPTPIIVGAMKNVMWQGDLKGKINLDTISNKKHLYGLGPIEGLKGEILILDGKCYTSKYVNDTIQDVQENYNVKAPFFAYANIEQWEEISLPDSVVTIDNLDKFINKNYGNKQPFFFKINAKVAQTKIHTMNLPNGIKVTSPQVAHDKGQKQYVIDNKEVIMLGFFSTKHQSIFTHHSTFTHLHLLINDKTMMGHLDELKILPNSATLLIPKI